MKFLKGESILLLLFGFYFLLVKSENKDSNTNLAYLEFGDPCDFQADQCDPLKYLSCDQVSSKCNCLNPNNTAYDNGARICKLLQGSICLERSNNKDVAIENQMCIKNAECINGQCECSNGALSNDKRECKLVHGASCSLDPIDQIDPCDDTRFQECSQQQQTCSCKPPKYGNSIYSSDLNNCLLTANSHCIPFPFETFQSCVEDSICDGRVQKCICEDGLMSNSLGKCVLSFAQNCSALRDKCDKDKHLECNEETQVCQCRDESVYDDEKETCRLLEGSICNQNEIGSEVDCVDRASCLPLEDSPFYKCRCNEPSIPNQNKQCFFPYNSTCDVISDYCDSSAFLKCSETNQCECMDGMLLEYSTYLKKCAYKVGETCFKTKEDEGPSCSENSECVATSEGLGTGRGICKCKEGYDNTGLSICLKSHGTNCSSSIECNSHLHLECNPGNASCQCKDNLVPVGSTTLNNQTICMGRYAQECDESNNLNCSFKADLKCFEGRCDCSNPSEQFYSPMDETCFSRLGSRCRLDSEGFELKCPSNSDCIRVNDIEEEFGICKCRNDFEQGINNPNECSQLSSAAIFDSSLWILIFSTILSYVL